MSPFTMGGCHRVRALKRSSKTTHTKATTAAQQQQTVDRDTLPPRHHHHTDGWIDPINPLTAGWSSADESRSWQKTCSRKIQAAYCCTYGKPARKKAKRTQQAMIPNRTTSAHSSRQTPYKNMAVAIASAQHHDHMARVAWSRK